MLYLEGDVSSYKRAAMPTAHILLARRRQTVRVQVATSTMAEPQIVVSIAVGGGSAFDGMGARRITAHIVCIAVRRAEGHRLICQVTSIGLGRAGGREQVLA